MALSIFSVSLSEARVVEYPFYFIPNHGQIDSKVKYYLIHNRDTVYLTEDEVVYSVKDQILRLKFIDSNHDVNLKGREEDVSRINYYTGNNPGKWRTGIPVYKKVVYEDLYDGIDLIYKGSDDRLKYEFVVRPGADYKKIQLAWSDKANLRIDDGGNLVIDGPYGGIKEERPYIYQDIDGKRVEIEGRFKIEGKGDKNNILNFEVEKYDVASPLIIDPFLQFSSYLGGSDIEEGFGIVVDASGSIYIAGYTKSTDFPTENPFKDINSGEEDVFISRFAPDGETYKLSYSTFLGGTKSEECQGIAVDASGNIYITGFTSSIDFPTAGNPYQSTKIGEEDDVFYTRLSSDGQLSASTYIGGTKKDVGNDIAVDASSNVYITGKTESTDFPTSSSAYQKANAGEIDAFILKISGDGKGLLYSTYIGGKHDDKAKAIAITEDGSAYVTGNTFSQNFPIQEAYQDTCGGCKTGLYTDAFIVRLSSDGDDIIYSTFLGGKNLDYGEDIWIDTEGAIYVTGYTTSANFPVLTPYQNNNRGKEDAFITKFSPAGDKIIYSTFLGGTLNDRGKAFSIDSSGYAYVTGRTASPDFPVLYPFQDSNKGEDDAFLTMLSPAGNAINFSTFMGGEYSDQGMAIAIDPDKTLYILGDTLSEDFPTLNPYQGNHSGFGDLFVLKLKFAPPGISSVTPVSGNQGESLDINIAGTNFSDNIISLSLGPMIVVGNVTINSPEQITASITIDGSAAPGFRDITLTTSDGIAALKDAFTVIDATPPEVVRTNPPEDSLGIGINTGISIVFSEDIDESTINGTTLTVSNTAGTVSYDSPSRTASFTPSEDLNKETIYVVTVTSDVKDVAGNNMVSDYIYSFTTGIAADTTPPEMSSTSPAKDAVDIAINTKISVTFSEDMNVSTINGSAFTVSNTEGTVRYDSPSRTAFFSPSGELNKETDYMVTVTSAVKDVAGNNMASDYTYSFTTGAEADTTRPEVDSTSPAKDAVDIALNTNISVTFSEDMDVSTINETTFIISDADDNNIEGTVSYDPTSKTASFTPSANLNHETKYTVVITTDVMDMATNSLKSDYTWSFKTRKSDGSEKGGCLITAALNNSYFQPHIKTLRKLRDKYLLTNPLGERFVKWYYEVSPPLADEIRQHAILKIIAQIVLIPLIFGLKYPATVLTSLGLVLLILFYLKKRTLFHSLQ